MTTQSTLKSILEKTIQREIESQHLYNDLSIRVKHAAAKEAFQELVRQEQGHQNMLEQYLQGGLQEGTLNRDYAIDYRIAEKLDQPEISADMKLPDIFLLAANREKMAHEFYLTLAEIHPTGPVKKLLEELAVEELAHKQKVEFLYTEVGFPQTDGG